MRLFVIRAFDTIEEADPVCSYIITAEDEAAAETLFADSPYSKQYKKLVISGGESETDVPGPQICGWVCGARMLKAGGNLPL